MRWTDASINGCVHVRVALFISKHVLFLNSRQYNPNAVKPVSEIFNTQKKSSRGHIGAEAVECASISCVYAAFNESHQLVWIYNTLLKIIEKASKINWKDMRVFWMDWLHWYSCRYEVLWFIANYLTCWSALTEEVQLPVKCDGILPKVVIRWTNQ